jgi:probable phosphoglycerate mutase
VARVPELLVLRHGETEWNRDGRFQGGRDSRLTERGRQQARQQHTILQGLDLAGHRWFSSPQPRAMTTATIAKGSGDDICPVPALREIGMGAWAGQRKRDLQAAHPRLDLDALSLYHHVPGGEALVDVAARVGRFLDTLTGPSVLVTHGVTLRLLCCAYLGRPHAAFDGFSADQGAVYRLTPSGCEQLGPLERWPPANIARLR